jgi:hypothetical protein
MSEEVFETEWRTYIANIRTQAEDHTLDSCDDLAGCPICSYRDCPHRDVWHYDPRGCPSCRCFDGRLCDVDPAILGPDYE